MAIAFIDRTAVIADLQLAGLRLVASMEGQRCPECGTECPTCKVWDTRCDADHLAADGRGLPVLVAYRNQVGSYDYDTITSRLVTDRGGRSSQVAKIIAGHSLANWHIQSYDDHIMVLSGAAMQAALRQRALFDCPTHPSGPQQGAAGQWFLTVCGRCAPSIRRVDR